MCFYFFYKIFKKKELFFIKEILRKKKINSGEEGLFFGNFWRE